MFQSACMFLCGMNIYISTYAYMCAIIKLTLPSPKVQFGLTISMRKSVIQLLRMNESISYKPPLYAKLIRNDFLPFIPDGCIL